MVWGRVRVRMVWDLPLAYATAPTVAGAKCYTIKLSWVVTLLLHQRVMSEIIYNRNTLDTIVNPLPSLQVALNPLKTIWLCYNTHFPLTPARVYSGLVFNGLIVGKLEICIIHSIHTGPDLVIKATKQQLEIVSLVEHYAMTANSRQVVCKIRAITDKSVLSK